MQQHWIIGLIWYFYTRSLSNPSTTCTTVFCYPVVGALKTLKYLFKKNVFKDIRYYYVTKPKD